MNRSSIITVRHLTSPEGYNIVDLPILTKGTLEQCHLYCEMFAGYKWKKDESIFGGYYAHEDTGDCLLLAPV